MKRYSSGAGPETGAKGAGSRPLFSPSFLFVAAAAVAVAGLVGWLALTQPGGSAGAPGTDAVGGPFHLVDQEGRAVDQSILKGHWSAVFFGYVSCPDVCPATMQVLATAQARLGADGDKVQDVFITVDPARDTSAQLKAWIDQPGFPRHVRALTGTPEQIAAAAKAYRIFYQRSGKGADYQMAHTAAIFLMNPEGRFVAPMSYEEGPDKLARDISAAMHGR